MSSPITLSVNGNATLYRRAERAVVTIKVSSEGSSQQKVSKDVTDTSNELRTTLKDLALKTPNGDAAPEAAITHWSFTSLSTGSHFPRNDEGKKLPREYTATASFTVRFRDFAELGTFATMVSTMEFVNVQRIEWELTDATKASLGTKSRIDAIKNAMHKATDYAQALGKDHVVAYEVIDGHGGVGVSQYYSSHGHGGHYRSGGGGAGGEELNFEPENVSFSCNVTVRYKAP